ncbi:hypothetical protein SAMN02745866_03386 [Alteromonadaceae bacterium Bs31]|nr:hypothetical protein SAMN02745866_03386 [Alteromonadaceae bacterium Bs31]
MERNDLHNLELALGIQSPWAIKSLDINEQQKVFELALELQDKKRLFGLFDANKKTSNKELVAGRWRYMSIGSYSCVVKAQVPKSAVTQGAFLSRSLIGQQAFLGDPLRPYSNYLRQQVALAQIKGTDPGVIAELYRIDGSTMSTILEDIQKAAADSRGLAYLPTEVDAAWDSILSDQLFVRTNMLPLKFLVSKLKLAASKTNSPDEMLALKVELRQFFIEHASQLDHEIEQICGITSERLQQRARAVKSKQRLVLPALKSPVWLDLLSGRLSLNSQSIPLNLLISRQRTAFVQGHNKEEKIEAIETLRDYFRKNYRQLKPELLLLNRAMDIRQKNKLSLPDPEHKVWQRILEDDTFVPSNHIAYKLLLAKLRAQVMKKPDPVIKLEAAQRIRDFLSQNRRSMREEMGVLLKQIAAV